MVIDRFDKNKDKIFHALIFSENDFTCLTARFEFQTEFNGDYSFYRSLCLKFPRKHMVMLTFLSSMLRDEVRHCSI